MHTPVALLLDFYSGWTFPRHLYTDKVYRVWGNLPYGPGDCLTDGILDVLYPGYQNSSYFHDESGFIAPTPYGDIADCLFSDAPLWLLKRYPLVVVAGELSGGRETRDKLQAYVESGGHLVVTAGNLLRMPDGLGGVLIDSAAGRRPDPATKDGLFYPPAMPVPGKATNATYGLALPDRPPERIIVEKEGSGGRPLGVQLGCGGGRLTVLTSPFGVDLQPSSTARILSETDKPLGKPYALREELRSTLDRLFRSQQLFDAGPSLGLITCRKGKGEYTLGVFNNEWRELPLKITSHCGVIESISELPLDQSEQGAAGMLPEGVDASKLGRNSEGTIAGGDIRLFAVKVKEEGVEENQHSLPPPRPRGRILPLRHVVSIKEAILTRPTFFEHFDGVCVDWRHLREREKAALQAESRWIRRQGLRVFVDLSSGVNLYPTLRLIDNLAADYSASMTTLADVLTKMEILGARDLIVSLHRHPENNFTDEQTRTGFERTLKAISAQAAERNVTLHLRMAFGKPPWNLSEATKLIDRIGTGNLRLAASTALLVGGSPSAEVVSLLKERLGLWLVAASRTDAAGHLWDAHTPLHQTADADSVARWIALAPDAPMLLDGVYGNQDDEYLDAVALERLIGKGK